MSPPNPYEKMVSVTETPREREFRLLSLVTRKLMDIQPLLEKRNADNIAKICDGLFHNREVWNAFITDVLHEENKLPRDLKVSLVQICIYVNNQTDKVLNGDNDVSHLISVNRNVMDGLKTNPAAGAPPAGGSPAAGTGTSIRG